MQWLIVDTKTNEAQSAGAVLIHPPFHHMHIWADSKRRSPSYHLRDPSYDDEAPKPRRGFGAAPAPHTKPGRQEDGNLAVPPPGPAAAGPGGRGIRPLARRSLYRRSQSAVDSGGARAEESERACRRY